MRLTGSLEALKETMVTFTYEGKETDNLSYHIKLWNFFDENNRIDYGELPECIKLKTHNKNQSLRLWLGRGKSHSFGGRYEDQ